MVSETADRRRDTDHYEQAECTGKRQLTRQDADRGVDYVQNQTGYKAQAYKCRYGDHWHVGKVKHRLASGVVVIERVGET